MPTSLRLTALTLSILLPATALAQAAAAPPQPQRTLHVSGEGKVNVQPDVARVFVGGVTTGKDLGKATQDAAAQLRKVLAALSKLGVADKDLLTVRHDVQVERSYSSGKPGPISGYTVNDQVQVTVRDLGKLGAVLDQVTKAGANSVDALAMDKDDPTPDRARALALAYAAARTKAEALARAAGVTLGEVLALEESSGPRGPIQPLRAGRMALMESSAQGAPVSTGDLELTGMVEVTFAIR